VARRSYRQPDCVLATALDLVGPRWTLLIVRELLVGPLRYTDLLDRLSGIGSNLLATRLHQLEEIGVVQRAELPPPAASTVYELTDLGQALEPAVSALAAWGEHYVDPEVEHGFDARREAFTLRRLIQHGHHEDEAAYQFVVDSEVLHARVCDGKVETGLGPIAQPCVTIRTDHLTWEMLVRARAVDDALDHGNVDVEGDASVLRRIFGTPEA
jgi:DNA-binding HxlR family transcriptional regulator